MLTFLKTLGTALYDFTLGSVVRLVRNTRTAKVDAQDKVTVGRLVTWTAYIALAVFMPEVVVFLAMFRMMVVMDVITTIANIFQSTANAYAE